MKIYLILCVVTPVLFACACALGRYNRDRRYRSMTNGNRVPQRPGLRN